MVPKTIVGWVRGIRIAVGVGVILVTVACAPKVETGAEAEVIAARERLEASPGGLKVLATIEAHGGLAAWYAAPTSAYHWEYANVTSDTRFKSYLVADNRTRHVYHDLKTHGSYEDAHPVDVQFAWDGTKAWVLPSDFKGVNARFWALTGYYFQSIPFVFSDPGLTYTVQPNEELEGNPYEVVQVSFGVGIGDAPGDTYALYLDPENHRLRAIRYTVTFFGGGNASASGPQRETFFYYEDWMTVDGLNVATHFRGFHVNDGVLGGPKNEAWSSDISFRAPFEAERLVAPVGAAIVPAP